MSLVAHDMRPDEGQTEYEEVQKELSSKEEELEVTVQCQIASFCC